MAAAVTFTFNFTCLHPPGTIDARELNVAMRYIYATSLSPSELPFYYKGCQELVS
jgi:hypothetical protein